MEKNKTKKVSICPQCGALENVDVNSYGLEACGVCALLGARYIENHPDSFPMAEPIGLKHKFRISRQRGKISKSTKERWSKYLNQVGGPTMKGSSAEPKTLR